MQRSLFTAVSGLRNHQIKMDVIGNNIANVNTTAFKAGRIRFQDILSQNIRGASAPQYGRGGINPAQVGLGMSIAAIDTNHSPGSLQYTGRGTDLAIQGNGFFVMSDGYNILYSRDGAFSRGADGDLVNPANGYKPLGWVYESDGTVNTNDALQSLNIPLGQKVTTKPTENMIFSSNLDAIADVGDTHVTEVIVYDTLGGLHSLEITFTKTAVNQWSWATSWIDPGGAVGAGSQGTVTFDTSGNYSASTGGPITFAPTGAAEMSIIPDFGSLSQIVGESNAMVRFQDGFPAGELESFTIGKTGIISGTFSNGLVRDLAQIALATFPNVEGLMKAAGNMYQISTNSGEPSIGAAGQEGRGLIETSTLEMSNVDLAYEFTEMITTTRAFQANSRVITSSDDLLQEIVNLKR